MRHHGLYRFIEGLVSLANEFETDIISQWDDAAIIIEPGADPFTVYTTVRNTARYDENGEEVYDY